MLDKAKITSGSFGRDLCGGVMNFFGFRSVGTKKKTNGQSSKRSSRGKSTKQRDPAPRPMDGIEIGEIGGLLDSSALPAIEKAKAPRAIAVLEVHPTAPGAKLLPIILSSKRSMWRRDDPDYAGGEAVPDDVRKKILERDRYTCRYCGFKSASWQEVHHLDDNHKNNESTNLVTACHLCHSCWHIGLAGFSGSSVLIWAPWIGQAQLNHLVRAIMVADSSGGRESEGAKALFLSLREMRRGAEERLGTSDPLHLANALLAVPDDLYASRGDILNGIRLLNLGKHNSGGANQMPKVLASWTSEKGAFSALPPQSWTRLLKRAEEEIAASTAARKA